MQTTNYDVIARYNIHLGEHTLTADKTIEHTVAVQRIETADDVTADIAAGVLDVMARAYGYQFEEAGPRMPRGTFKRLFDAGDGAKVHAQTERMHQYVAEGSVYSLIANPHEDDQQIALAKVSPSRANRLQKMGLQSPNVYLNDIATHPYCQGFRFASVALFDALASGCFDTRRALALDGFVGNNLPNRWFERLGLRRVAVDIKPFVVDEEQDLALPQERYSSQGQATVGDIIEELRESNDITAHKAA